MLGTFIMVLISALTLLPEPQATKKGNMDSRSMKSAKVTYTLNGDTVKDIKEIAVYPYDSKYDLALPDEMKFFITEKKDVDKVIKAFDYETFDGRELGAAPSAYIFLKDSKNRITKGMILGWEYLLFDDDWKHLRPLSQEAGDVLEDALKLCHNKGKSRP